MNVTRTLLALAIVPVLTSVAHGELITGLFRTGVDNSGTVQQIGSVDAHYTLNGGIAFVQPPELTNYPATTWVTSPTAQWIGPTPDNEFVSDSILYNYTTSFTLPSDADVSSVRLSITLASDNGVTILVNGIGTGLPVTQSQFLAFTTFSVDAQGSPYYKTGTNTLEFSVENGPGFGPNPTGLLITAISGSYTVTPEPSTFIVALVGGGLWLGYAWRRRHRDGTHEHTGHRARGDV